MRHLRDRDLRPQVSSVELEAVQPDVTAYDIAAAALTELSVMGQQHGPLLVRIHGQIVIAVRAQPGLVGAPRLVACTDERRQDRGGYG